VVFRVGVALEVIFIAKHYPKPPHLGMRGCSTALLPLDLGGRGSSAYRYENLLDYIDTSVDLKSEECTELSCRESGEEWGGKGWRFDRVEVISSRKTVPFLPNL
jgi:hypothetical protein